MKLSKQAKMRIKRLNKKQVQDVLKAASLLADMEIITGQRFATILRTLKSNSSLL